MRSSIISLYNWVGSLSAAGTCKVSERMEGAKSGRKETM